MASYRPPVWFFFKLVRNLKKTKFKQSSAEACKKCAMCPDILVSEKDTKPGTQLIVKCLYKIFKKYILICFFSANIDDFRSNLNQFKIYVTSSLSLSDLVIS